MHVVTLMHHDALLHPYCILYKKIANKTLDSAPAQFTETF